MSKSIIRQVSKQDIIDEYAEARRLPFGYQRAKWGSEEGMLNRFRLGLSLVDWPAVKRWLDVGCGEADFFTLAEEAGHRFQELVGVDISPDLLSDARKRAFLNPTSFYEADLERMPEHLVSLDLITLVGVLQQCAAPPEIVLTCCTQRLRPGGQLFLTTKNIGWEAFTSGSLIPEPSHSWFDYSELVEKLHCLGVKIQRSGGFLPRTGESVRLEQSHTFFVLARKNV